MDPRRMQEGSKRDPSRIQRDPIWIQGESKTDQRWTQGGSKKEVHVKLNELPFVILPVLLAEGSGFHAGLEHENAAAEGPPQFHKTSLRVRDPFG